MHGACPSSRGVARLVCVVIDIRVNERDWKRGRSNRKCGLGYHVTTISVLIVFPSPPLVELVGKDFVGILCRSRIALAYDI